MARERIDAVENRLRELERRVELIDYRLRSVEHWRTGAQVPEGPPPPPVALRAMRPPIDEPQQEARPEPPPIIAGGWQQVSHNQVPSGPPAVNRDTEYDIGAKLLPKLGAMLVLGAILYFVAWGYSAGWITKSMIFTGEILFCLAFIGVGQWKRNEREQYGQILTGIGSCGLYASLAGGHLVQDLFSGEVLVGAFMGLSLANLAYGLWSRSKAFYAIGLLGGFSAALLPMREDKTTLNAILHLCIVAPAVWVAVRRKWADMAGALWLTSALALIPLMLSPVDWRLQIGTLYLASLAGVAAYLYGAEKNSFDPEGWLAPTMLFTTGLIGLALEHNRIGSVHLLALGAVSAIVALAARSVPVYRDRAILTAIAIPATLAPICFTNVECVAIYTGLSLAAAAICVAVKQSGNRASGFAAVEFVLSMAAYLTVQSWNPLPVVAEAWLLVGLMAAGVSSAYVSVKAGGPTEPFTMGAMAILLPLFGRLGIVTLTGSTVAASAEFAAAQALTFFAIAAILVTARTRWISAMIAMWSAFAIATAAYAYAVAFGNVPAIQDAVLVAVLAATVVLGLPAATGTAPVDFRKAIAGSAGILVGLMLMRLAFVVAPMPKVGFDPWLTICLVAAGYSVAASGVAIVRKSDPACAVTWAMFAASGIAYLSYPGSQMPLAHEMAIVTGLLASFIAATAGSRRLALRDPEIWHAVALIGWVLFSSWLFTALTWGGIDLHGASSLTIAWIVYALALISTGFALKVRELRYWSFAVMFATVSKILLVDLANTSTPFRVGVLLGLGLLMLGGGYWYIRGRRTPFAT